MDAQEIRPPGVQPRGRVYREAREGVVSVPALQFDEMVRHLCKAAAAARSTGTLSSVMDCVRRATAGLANLEVLGNYVRSTLHTLPGDDADGAYIVEVLCGGETRLGPLSLTKLLHTSTDAMLPLVYSTSVHDLQVRPSSVSCCPHVAGSCMGRERLPSVISLSATNLHA